jgi:hypothetical protein
MKALSKAASQVLDTITAGLLPLAHPDATARRIGPENGPFMQVVVERLDAQTYSVAHYGTQNGDAMRDPEMVFAAFPDGQGGTLWYALSYRNDYVGSEQTSAEIIRDARGGVAGFNVRERLHRDHTRFATVWMRNIKAQHAHALVALRRQSTASLTVQQ